MAKEKNSEKISAGLLMYRKKNENVEVFLVHPGGPYFAKKEEAVWSFPKGLVEEGEDLLETAKREFEEETGIKVPETEFIELKPLKRPGKIVHVWAFEGDCDPTKIISNTCMVEWPPRSGKKIEIPEVDKADFFDLETAKTKLSGYLAPVVEDFSLTLSEK